MKWNGQPAAEKPQARAIANRDMLTKQKIQLKSNRRTNHWNQWYIVVSPLNLIQQYQFNKFRCLANYFIGYLSSGNCVPLHTYTNHVRLIHIYSVAQYRKFHEIYMLVLWWIDWSNRLKEKKNRRKKEKSNIQPIHMNTLIHMTNQCYRMLIRDFDLKLISLHVFELQDPLCVCDSVPIPLNYLDINLR